MEITKTPRPAGGYPKHISWPCPAVEAENVSHRILKELFVYGGEQTRVVVAFVTKNDRPPNITIANVVHYVLRNWRAANFSCDDDTDGKYFVRLPSAKDVEKFHGYGWWWLSEFVSFRVLTAIIITW